MDRSVRQKLVVGLGVVALAGLARWGTGCASDDTQEAIPSQTAQQSLAAGPVAVAESALAIQSAKQAVDECGSSLEPALGDAGAQTDAQASDPSSDQSDGAAVGDAGARPGAGRFTRFDQTGSAIRPRWSETTAEIENFEGSSPSLGTGALKLRDKKSALAISVSLANAASVAPAAAGDRLVYPGAAPGGGDWIHKANPQGMEDFVIVKTKPASPEVWYDVALENVAGLRVGKTIVEFLDPSGDPALRLRAGEVRDANCVRVEPTVLVQGCEFSTDPTPPWGRKPTPPGAGTCRVGVRWDDASLTYPVVVDPSYTNRTMVVGVRNGPFASITSNVTNYLRKGDVVVVGSFDGNTDIVQVYSWMDKNWAWAGSMPGLTGDGTTPTPNRKAHQFTLLNGTSGIVSGGRSVADNSLATTTPRLNLLSFQWTVPAGAPGLMRVARADHRALSLPDGRTLVVGGETTPGSYVLANEVYSSTSGWQYDSSVLSNGRISHSLVRLSTGRVVVIGGWQSPVRLGSIETFIPAVAGQASPGTVATTPWVTISPGREWLGAVVRSDDSILLAGGYNGSELATVDIIKPDGTKLVTGAPAALPEARSGPGVVAFPSSTRFLVAGGYGPGTLPLTNYGWDPGGATPTAWTTSVAASFTAHAFPIVATRNDSREVLIAGGHKAGYVLNDESTTWNLCATDCDDGNPCTDNLCDVNGQCQNPPIQGGGVVSCADTNVCNGSEFCDGFGHCLPGTPVNVVDSNDCTENTCDPVTGLNPLKPDGTQCDDGNACTTASTCQSGSCVASANAAAGTACKSDGDACNGAEICNAYGVCYSPGFGPGSSSESPGITDPCYETTCSATVGFVQKLKASPQAGCAVTSETVRSDVVTDIADLAGVLYTGTGAKQTGTNFPGGTEGQRSIVSGRVLWDDFSPRTGAVVKVLNHTEFGQTTSGTDGRFDLAVNGGATYVIQIIEPSGTAFEIQRRVVVGWQDWTTLDDVVMTPTANDGATTAAFSFPTGSTYRLVKGPASAATDGDGARTPALIIPDGTGIVSGNLSNVNVGFREYTFDRAGVARMPGELPPVSAYTYALDLRLYQNGVLVPGDVSFTKPLIFYLDSFPKNNNQTFAPGTIIPAGFYDRDTAVWLASNTSTSAGAVGRVVKIASGCSGTTGTAILDTDNVATNDTETGDNCLPGFSPPCTTAQQIPAAERQQICAAGYANGKSYWRVPISHFSPWDLNLAKGPPAGAKASDAPDPHADNATDSDTCPGSIIECQNQALAEEFDVEGTPFKLRYQSNRQVGRRVSIDVPYTSQSLPPNLIRVDVNVRIAGRTFKQSIYPPIQPNQTMSFAWDRLDALGRTVSASIPAHVEVGYV